MAARYLRLLGTARVDLIQRPQNQAVESRAQKSGAGVVPRFRSRRTVALLGYLAAERRPAARDLLAALFWPDADLSKGRGNLRRELHNLSQILPGCWQLERQTIAFIPSDDTIVDIYTLLELEAEDRWGEAVELLGGEFLEGLFLNDNHEYETWLLGERERWRVRAEAILTRVIERHTLRGQYADALQHGRRLLQLAPWKEGIHRQIMRLLVWTGQRGAALRQYDTCKQVLKEELDIEPSVETEALYHQIRDCELDLPPKLPAFITGERSGHEIDRPLFVAREHELAQLENHLERVLNGNGLVVMVVGEAGRGKTSLLEEFSRRIQQEHEELLVVNGLCNTQSDIGDPYLPFRQGLEMLTGGVEARWAAGQMTGDHARRLWGVLPRTAQLILMEGPDLIDTLVSGGGLVRRVRSAVPWESEWLRRLERQVQVRSAAQNTGEMKQTDLFEQYSQVLLGVARQIPLVVLLDDLQWADAGSVGLLFHLGRQVMQGKILLVCAFRPEEMAVGEGRNVVQELRRVYGEILIDLDRNDLTEGRRFVDAFLDSEPNRLGEAFRERLYEQTEGHPLFTVEQLRMLVERGDLVRDGGGCWLESETLTWDRSPARVEAVIERRIGGLSPELREALAVASVEGDEFTAQVVARVLGLREREWLRELSVEVEKQHRLVREQGEVQGAGYGLSRYRFSHNLFQNHLYNGLSAGERRLLHGEVAKALEALYPVGAAVVQLAFHYTQAGMRDKAVRYLTLAGKHAWTKYAGQEAIQYYSQALRLLSEDDPRRFELLAARSAVYELVADRERQRADIETMLALAEGWDDKHCQCDALIAMGDYFLETEPFLAREPLQQAGDIARALDDRVREAHVLRRMAWAGRLGSDFQTCRVYIDEAAARFKEANLPGEAASCLLMLTRRLVGYGEHYAEIEAAGQALALSRQAGYLRQEAIALRHLAIAQMNQGLPHKALPLARHALAMHRELRDRSEVCYSLDVLGVVLARLGRSEEAEAHFRDCLTLAEKIDSDWGVLGAAFGLCNYWYLPRGEYEQLLTFSDERQGKARASGHEWLMGFFNWIKHITFSDLGQFEEALELLQAEIPSLLDQGDTASHALVLAECGRLMVELGDYSTARKSLDAALEMAEKTGDSYLVSWPLTNQAHLILLEGQQDEWRYGVEKAQRAIAECREVHEVRQLAEALHVCTRLHLAQDELEPALETSIEVLGLLESTPALPKPHEYRYTHARVLRALGRDAEVDEYLQLAYEWVMHVATKLTDEKMRQSWLENVAVNREIVVEWSERGA